MLLPVRPGERRLTFTLFLHSFVAVGAFVAGRTVRDALFLSHEIRSQLAWMYVLSALTAAAVGFVYSRLAAKVRRDRMALGTAVFLAVPFLLLWALERHRSPALYVALYALVEVMGALVLVQFWTLANELFHARDAKRLYGLIGAGGTFANIFVGLLCAHIGRTWGAGALLPLCAGLLVLTGVASYWGGRFGRSRLLTQSTRATRSSRAAPTPSQVLRDPHLRQVAWLSALTFFTTTLVDYQFKRVASAALPAEGLASYFGYFSAMVGFLALGLQLVGTGRTIQRIGVIGALAVLPVSLSVGNLALMVFPSLWAAALTKGADQLFRYSINDATSQILYLPAPAKLRALAKALIDGLLKPLSIAAAGLLLVAIQYLFTTDGTGLVWLSLPLALGWVALVVRMRPSYLQSLQSNLTQRVFDLETVGDHTHVDAHTRRVLERALASSRGTDVLSALGLLPQLESIDLDHRVEALLEHPSTQVRIKALEYYGQRQSMRFANSVFRRFEDADPAVQAAAISAFCAIGRDRAVRSVRPFLTAEDARIRAAAVTGMIRYGGLDGVLVAAEALKGLIEHNDPTMRREGAKVLGAIGVTNFYQPVLQLMNDVDLHVRRAAIVAAGSLRSPECLTTLLYRTQDRDTAREAIDALAAYGGSVIATLDKVLSNHLEDTSMRRAAARVLGRLGNDDAIEVMLRHVLEGDEALRGVIYKSLARGVKNVGVPLKDTKPIHRAIDEELQQAWHTLHQLEILGLDRSNTAALQLLATTLNERVRFHEQRLFWLLAVLYPEAQLEQWSVDIRGHGPEAQRQRANAIELLDNLLERRLRVRLVPLIEDGSRSARLAQVSSMYPAPTSEPALIWDQLLADRSPWVSACATWCHQGRPETAPLPMLSTVERVLFLKTIDLFSQIPAEDLAAIAAIATEERRDDTEEIFGEGDEGDTLYLITSGKVRVQKGDRFIADLSEGECFGEMALLDTSPRSATVTAASELHVLKLTRDDFQDIMAEKPEIAQGVIKVLTRRLREANK